MLFLSRWFPYPADNGSKIRILNILQQLSQRHEVTLLSFGQPDELESTVAIKLLREHCARVKVLPYREFGPSGPRALVGLLSPRPRFLVDTDRSEMRDAVAAETCRRTYDLVVASQLDMAPYALGLPGVPALLEELELASFHDSPRTASLAGRWRSSLMWFR